MYVSEEGFEPTVPGMKSHAMTIRPFGHRMLANVLIPNVKKHHSEQEQEELFEISRSNITCTTCITILHIYKNDQNTT